MLTAAEEAVHKNMGCVPIQRLDMCCSATEPIPAALGASNKVWHQRDKTINGSFGL